MELKNQNNPELLIWDFSSKILRSEKGIEKLDNFLVILFLKYLLDLYTSKNSKVQNFRKLELLLKLFDNSNEIREGLIKDIIEEISNSNKKINSIGELYSKGIYEQNELHEVIRLSSIIDFNKLIQEDNSKHLSIFNSIFDRKFSSHVRYTSSHNTPKKISLLISNILNPKIGDLVYDPTCGFGTNLVEVSNQVSNLELYGQDINIKMTAYSQISLLINTDSNFEVICGDTIMNPYFIENGDLKKFDIVLSNPPFYFDIDADYLKNDRFDRFKYGTPSNRGFLHALMQHIISSLNDNGKGVIIIPKAVLQRRNSDQIIIKNIILDKKIEAIISLPANVFPGTSVETAILLFNNSNKDESIFFVNFKKLVLPKYINKFEFKLNDDDMRRLLEIIRNKDEIENISKKVSFSTLESNDYKLIVEKYTNTNLENLLPEGVDTVNLQEVADVFSGRFIPRDSLNDFGKFYYLNSSDLTDMHMNIPERRVDVVDNIANQYILHPFDIVFSFVNNKLKIAQIPEDYPQTIPSSSINIIRPLNIDSDYLFNFFNTEIGKKILIENLETNYIGSTIGIVNKEELRKLRIPIIDRNKESNITYLENTFKELLKNQLLKLGWDNENLISPYKINNENLDFVIKSGNEVISIFKIISMTKSNEYINTIFKNISQELKNDFSFYIINEKGLFILDQKNGNIIQAKSIPSPIK